MSRCDYVSSAGFRVFFDLRKDLNARQGELAFCNIQRLAKIAATGNQNSFNDINLGFDRCIDRDK